MDEIFESDGIKLYLGDCLEVMKGNLPQHPFLIPVQPCTFHTALLLCTGHEQGGDCYYCADSGNDYRDDTIPVYWIAQGRIAGKVSLATRRDVRSFQMMPLCPRPSCKAFPFKRIHAGNEHMTRVIVGASAAIAQQSQNLPLLS